MGEAFDPEAFWSERLERPEGLRGTGHALYSPGYNRWLYLRKALVLRRVLAGAAPGRALDVGSGTGWVVERLLRRGFDVTGCDVAPAAVDRLAARLPAARFHVAAFGRQPLPGGPYDLVTMLDVAYHVVGDEEFQAGVRDLGAVLGPGGRVVVTDGFGDRSVSAAAHVRFRSRADWDAALLPAGLEIATLRPYFRWLSRDPEAGRLAHLPGRLRGAVELALEYVAPVTPHMRCAVLRRSRS